MRIVIVAIGSRGDVQPYIALGKGLLDAGHEVVLASHAEFSSLFNNMGFEFVSMKANLRDLLDQGAAKAMMESGGNFILFFKSLTELLGPFLRTFVNETLAASRGADLLILSPLGGIGLHVSEKLKIPFCSAMLQPFTSTRSFENPLFPEYPSWIPFGRGFYNYESFYLFPLMYWQFGKRITNEIRKEMGLPGLKTSDVIRAVANPDLDVLYGYSPSFIPVPPDWKPNNHVTGYWFLDSESKWNPSSELVDFIESGPSPVSIGFGSMKSRNPEEKTSIVIKALEKARQRGILLTGNDGLNAQDLPDFVFAIPSVPHDWLFPKVSAVVHHGGAGTTGAGLRFGKPTVTVPYLGDQPFWGRQVYKAGVGVKPIPGKSLSSERLADAIKIVTSDTAMKRRADELGAKIRAEDGVSKAVKVINQFLRK